MPKPFASSSQTHAALGARAVGGGQTRGSYHVMKRPSPIATLAPKAWPSAGTVFFLERSKTPQAEGAEGDGGRGTSRTTVRPGDSIAAGEERSQSSSRSSSSPRESGMTFFFALLIKLIIKQRLGSYLKDSIYESKNSEVLLLAGVCAGSVHSSVFSETSVRLNILGVWGGAKPETSTLTDAGVQP